MSFDGSKAVLIKDLSGNVVSVASGGNLSITGTISATASVSGQVVSTSGGAVKISGETVSVTAGTIFRTRVSGYLPVTDVSGGASVGSGVVGQGAILRNMSGSVNGIIWVGGSGTNLSPFSGHGYPLLTDDQFEVKVTNFLQLRVVANISGVSLAATGVDF